MNIKELLVQIAPSEGTKLVAILWCFVVLYISYRFVRSDHPDD